MHSWQIVVYNDILLFVHLFIYSFIVYYYSFIFSFIYDVYLFICYFILCICFCFAFIFIFNSFGILKVILLSYCPYHECSYFVAEQNVSFYLKTYYTLV